MTTNSRPRPRQPARRGREESRRPVQARPDPLVEGARGARVERAAEADAVPDHDRTEAGRTSPASARSGTTARSTSSAAPGTRKSRNLARNPSASVAFSLTGIDLVIEGTATKVTDDATLQHMAKRYADQGWPATVKDGAFTHEYSAPSAGPPPWYVYEDHADDGLRRPRAPSRAVPHAGGSDDSASLEPSAGGARRRDHGTREAVGEQRVRVGRGHRRRVAGDDGVEEGLGLDLVRVAPRGRTVTSGPSRSSTSHARVRAGLADGRELPVGRERDVDDGALLPARVRERADRAGGESQDGGRRVGDVRAGRRGRRLVQRRGAGHLGFADEQPGQVVQVGGLLDDLAAAVQPRRHQAGGGVESVQRAVTSRAGLAASRARTSGSRSSERRW